MIWLSAVLVFQRQTWTHVPLVGADPDPPWLEVAVVACLLAEPALCWVDVLVDASWAASTTSILPPNWKALFLMVVLFF